MAYTLRPYPLTLHMHTLAPSQIKRNEKVVLARKGTSEVQYTLEIEGALHPLQMYRLASVLRVTQGEGRGHNATGLLTLTQSSLLVTLHSLIHSFQPLTHSLFGTHAHSDSQIKRNEKVVLARKGTSEVQYTLEIEGAIHPLQMYRLASVLRVTQRGECTMRPGYSHLLSLPSSLPLIRALLTNSYLLTRTRTHT